MHSINNNSQRKHIPRKIYTPTQKSSATIAKYYLLFFNETETYQIVAKSSIKCVDDHGIATITIDKKQIKGKTILTDSFDECEKEMSRRTRLSQQDNNNDFDSQKDDADVENDVVTVDTQHQISTQSQFAHDSLARLNYESASEDREKENEKYNEDDELSDQYVKSITKKNTIKRKPTTDHVDKKRKKIVKEGASILNAIENKFLGLENKLLSIDSKNDQQMTHLAKKNDHLTASSIYMYEDTNLLRTVASSFGDFARKTMRLVFSQHELTPQILPPQRHYLARTSLNEKQFQLVNERRRGLKRIGRDHIQNETMENSS
ncbi:unnamed protein product [Adineta steineri]|uniref:Uncharacterized protein n=1 Tax=Adineta steineri TaxID=433720 RepID=A0A819CG26_9BILA|nr:unnamed protein product [Adineta steineri]